MLFSTAIVLVLILTANAEFCNNHEDCFGNQICFSFSCIPARQLTTTCTSGQQCPSPFACKSRRCWTTTDSAGQCQIHDQCSGQQICVNSVCQAAVPISTFTQSCTTDTNCPLPNACKFQRCWTTATKQSQQCQSHEQCDGQQVCQASSCEPAVTFGSTICNSHSQCPPPSNACKFQRCWVSATRQNKCQSHDDCDGQQICISSACVAAVPVRGTQCNINDHCFRSNSNACKFNICWKAATGQERCQTHDDCAGQQICSNSACVAAIPIRSTQCSNDNQCTVTKACKFQMCWTFASGQNQCQYHEDCDGQQICSNSGCTAAVQIPNTFCSSDLQCDAPYACKYRSCWTFVNTKTKYCQNHDQCDGQNICYNSACAAAVPMGISQQCTVDGHCTQVTSRQSFNACKFQICWTLVNGRTTQCFNHEDCPGQQVCLYSSCVAATPTNYRCSSNADCNNMQAQQFCRFQICWAVIVTRDQCQTHSDCSGQQLCQSNACIDAFPVVNTQCNFDNQCIPPQGCKFQICWNPSNRKSQCQTHNDCSGPQLCQMNGCTDAVLVANSKCAMDSQCIAPQACKFQMCWTPSSAKNQCQTHNDCSQQQICVINICTAAVPIANSRCAADNQCIAPQACKFQMCWTPEKNSCQSHTDCNDQQICLSNACTAAVAVTNTWCMTDSQCIAPQVCKLQMCWISANGKSPCQSHADCNEQQICLTSKCTAAVLIANTRCSSDNQCNRMQACKYQMCWSAVNDERSRCDNPNDQPAKSSNGDDQMCAMSIFNTCPMQSQCSTFGYCCITTNPTGSGHYGQLCNNGICYDSNTICSKNYCSCYKNYFYDGRVCSKKPLLNEQCTPRQLEQVCSTDYTECVNNRCTCITGYIAKGQTCIRNRQALNGPCTLNEECGSAYSQCMNTKCSCRTSFIQEGQNCRPNTFNCPSGQPLKDPRGREIPCEIYQNNPVQQSTSSKLRFMDTVQKNETVTKNETKRMWSRDSCTNEAYCVSYGGATAIGTSNSKGYCCPRPAFSCPAGSPLATSDAFCRNCPQDLYFCFTDSSTGASACCPKPCPKGDVYVNGGCLPMVSLGSQCVTHEQCMDIGSRCTALVGSTVTLCTCSQDLINVENVCTEPICMLNGAVTKPLTDLSGIVTRCTTSATCPAPYICNSAFKVCCISNTRQTNVEENEKKSN